MSKQFIKGNVYVFSAKKFKQWEGSRVISNTWPASVNGNIVTVKNKYDGDVGAYKVDPVWCKCIKNNNLKNESEAI